MEAAGIAPASLIPLGVLQEVTCNEHGCQWLHYGCAEEALRGHVAAWHRLAPEVREAILNLASYGSK
jgi:hypothetical protein